MFVCTWIEAETIDWLGEVCDEESSQFKGFHYIFGYIGVGGSAEPELAHPMWNSYKRALRDLF